MAFVRRGGVALNAPKVLTFAVSAILVAAAAASLHVRLPVGASFVAQHRFSIAVAGYLLLAAGCLLPGL